MHSRRAGRLRRLTADADPRARGVGAVVRGRGLAGSDSASPLLARTVLSEVLTPGPSCSHSSAVRSRAGAPRFGINGPSDHAHSARLAKGCPVKIFESPRA